MTKPPQAHPPSINVFEEINSICKEFRKQHKSGLQPRVEDFLIRIPELARATLFANLLQLEIHYSALAGHPISSEGYVKRFPQFGSQIRQAFDESTMMSMEAVHSTPADSPEADLRTRTMDLPAANRLGEYHLIRELGRGGFGVVYEAKHLTRQNHVALKTLPTGVDGQELNAERLHKFRHEFRSLSEINHPNLIGMQTLEVDGGQWFFTMDLVRGQDFLSYVRPQVELDEARLRGALSQLVGGIIALHKRNIVHRDLKPSNVLVDGHGTVTILDFGLVAELQQESDQTASLKSAHFAGTPRYAAPEQMFGQRSQASDWYALGVMLYEALTGQPPFTGSPLELLNKKQNEDPPRLADRQELPQDLAKLADALLNRDPKLRPNAVAIAQALSLTLESKSHGSADSADNESTFSTGTEQILIGRETQLAELEQARRDLMETRRPIVVFLSGRSGEGKSSLAEKFLQPIRLAAEMLVLSGRCYDRESVPFKAVDSLIDALVAFLRSRKPDVVQALLPDDIRLLAYLFPLLRRVESIASISTAGIANIESDKLRHRAFQALRELLINITRTIPVVILIDDLQWGDSDSAKVLFNLLAPPAAPTILFLGSFRSDEISESSFLQHWNDLVAGSEIEQSLRRVEVGPLSGKQCIELAALRSGVDRSLIKQRAPELLEETGGNPYFVEQLIEGFNPEAGTFQSVPLQEIIARRLEKLPADASSLLEVIAVSGQALSAAEVSETCGLSASGLGTLTHMRSERLVRLIGSKDQMLVDTYHDKVRETVLNGLSESQRRQWHLQLAETIERHQPITGAQALSQDESRTSEEAQTLPISRVFDLAHHFYEAQDGRAFAYQLLAGEQALRAFALDEAIRYFERADALLPEGSNPALKFRLSEAMGRAYLGQKDTEKAKRSFEWAVSIATATIDRAMALEGLGQVFQQIGRLVTSVSYFDKALLQLGIRRSRTTFGRLWVFFRVCVQTIAVPAKWQRCRDPRRAKLAESEQRIFRRMVNSLAETDNMFAALDGNAREIRAGMRSGQDECVALSYGGSAYFLAGVFGSRRISKMMLGRLSHLESKVNDPELRAFVPYFRGNVDYFLGEPRLAAAGFEASFEQFSHCGENSLSLHCLHYVRHSHAYIATSNQELESARQELELAQPTKNINAVCWGHYGIANSHARSGDLISARTHMANSFACFTDEPFYVTEAICQGTDAFVWLQCSDYFAAVRSCEASLKIIEKRFLYADWTVRTFPLYLEALVGPNWANPLDSRNGKRVKSLARKARLLFGSNPNLQPHIQRARGRAFYALGRTKKAIRCFEHSIRLARKKGMDYDLGRSLLDLAAVKEKGREANRCEAVELLKKMESVIPYAERWLLGDKPDMSVVAPPYDPELAAEVKLE